MPASHGEYLIHEAVAQGGMAAVHRGEFVGAHGYRRTVAIKRLKPNLAADPEFVAMLLDEARLSGRLSSPHWARVLDTVTVGRELMLVMEWAPGVPLSALLAAGRQANAEVPVGVAVAIGVSLLAALADAHSATDEVGRRLGIVHRDVSPQNVLVAPDGFVRVIDLGVAKAAWRAQSTRSGEIKGKPMWMAPEQLLGEAVDARADLFGVGVILWEALEGRRLHHDDGVPVVLERLRRGLPSFSRDLPAPLAAAVARALSWSPADRFPDACAMAAALEAAAPLAPPGEVARWAAAFSDPGAVGVLPVPPIDGPPSHAVARASAAEFGSGDGVATTLRNPVTGRHAARRALLGAALAGLALGGVGVAAVGRARSVPGGAQAVPHEVRGGAPASVPSSGAVRGTTSSARAGQVVEPPPISSNREARPSEPPSAVAGRPAPQPRRASAGRGLPAIDCKPPWTTDASGVRTWKRECL